MEIRSLVLKSLIGILLTAVSAVACRYEDFVMALGTSMEHSRHRAVADNASDTIVRASESGHSTRVYQLNGTDFARSYLGSRNPTGAIQTAAAIRNGSAPQTIVVGNTDGEIRIYNRAGRLLHTLRAHVLYPTNNRADLAQSGPGGPIRHLFFYRPSPANPSRDQLVAVGRNHIWRWNARSWQPILGETNPNQAVRALQSQLNGISAVANSRNGRYLVTAGTLERTISVWDLRSTFPTPVRISHGANINAIALNDRVAPNLQNRPRQNATQVLVAAAFGNEVRISNQRGDTLQSIQLEERRPRSLSFSSTGSQLAIGNADGSVSIRRVSNGTEVSHFSSQPGWGTATQVRFAGDQHILVSYSDGRTRLWQRHGRRTLLVEFVGNTSPVERLQLLQDGRFFTVSDAGIHVFDIPPTN